MLKINTFLWLFLCHLQGFFMSAFAPSSSCLSRTVCWKAALRVILRKFQATCHLLRARLWMWFDFTAVQHPHHKATPENSSLGGAAASHLVSMRYSKTLGLRLTGLTLALRPSFIPTLYGSREIKISQNLFDGFEHFVISAHKISKSQIGYIAFTFAEHIQARKLSKAP